MTITSSGMKCDVCGEYIFFEYQEFSVSAVGERRLHCCVPKCKQALIDAGKDWEKLPDGPLRAAFSEAVSRITPVAADAE